MLGERKQCDRTNTHIGHQWGIEYADMGTAWYECPGIDWMFAPYNQTDGSTP
jgi:hypothetical protein